MIGILHDRQARSAHHVIWLVLLLLLQAACHREPALPVWTNLDTRDAFTPPFEVFRSGERREVNSCDSAVAAIRDGFEPRNPVDYAPLRLAALHCRAQQLVASAQPSTSTHWTGTDSVPAALLPAEGWHYRVTLAARGDFNADGLEDRLFSLEQWPSSGTARQVRFLLLEKKSATAPPAVFRELAW